MITSLSVRTPKKDIPFVGYDPTVPMSILSYEQMMNECKGRTAESIKFMLDHFCEGHIKTLSDMFQCEANTKVIAAILHSRL